MGLGAGGQGMGLRREGRGATSRGAWGYVERGVGLRREGQGATSRGAGGYVERGRGLDSSPWYTCRFHVSPRLLENGGPHGDRHDSGRFDMGKGRPIAVVLDRRCSSGCVCHVCAPLPLLVWQRNSWGDVMARGPALLCCDFLCAGFQFSLQRARHRGTTQTPCDHVIIPVVRAVRFRAKRPLKAARSRMCGIRGPSKSNGIRPSPI